MQQFQCSVCQSTDSQFVRTYKHEWEVCTECHTSYRNTREKFPIQNWLPGPLIKLLPYKLKELLIPNKYFSKTEADQYRYYQDIAARGIAETKWEGELRAFNELCREFGLNLENRRVLDMSGGPGFRGKEISKVADHVAITEFNADAARGMAESLGMDVRKFDYNTDDLERVFADERFDIVLIRHSIGYCTDLDKFILSLKKILNPHAAVQISFPEPTLGFYLRWQLLEYNYTSLYSFKALKERFEANGFRLEKTKKTVSPLTTPYPQKSRGAVYKRLLLAWIRNYMNARYSNAGKTLKPDLASTDVMNYSVVFRLLGQQEI